MASENISENLPGDAQDAGLMLIWHRQPIREYPDREVGGLESVTLLNRDRQALFFWPYCASLGEVRDKSMELLKEGRIYD